MSATIALIWVLLVGQANDAGVLAARVQALGGQLRIERKEDVPVYQRAMANGGPESLDRLLKEFTLAVLRAYPEASADSLEAELRAVYDPWSTWSDVHCESPASVSDVAGRSTSRCGVLAGIFGR